MLQNGNENLECEGTQLLAFGELRRSPFLLCTSQDVDAHHNSDEVRDMWRDACTKMPNDIHHRLQEANQPLRRNIAQSGYIYAGEEPLVIFALRLERVDNESKLKRLENQPHQLGELRGLQGAAKIEHRRSYGGERALHLCRAAALAEAGEEHSQEQRDQLQAVLFEDHRSLACIGNALNLKAHQLLLESLRLGETLKPFGVRREVSEAPLPEARNRQGLHSRIGVHEQPLQELPHLVPARWST
mmetsp:Transcript_4889/g.16961  ORF Transcript_4889/g.16961 Transcript_4889/m.16961 type:complete len:244 (-) Transcript_4889:723-1454(-)